MWQTDFTDLKVIGWGWLYLSTILGFYARQVIGWKLCGTLRAEDVTDTALAAPGCNSAKVLHKPRLLSDRAIEAATGSSPVARGSAFIAEDLAKYLADKGTTHVRGLQKHPQIRGRIERRRQTLKNRIELAICFLEVDEAALIDL